VALAELLEKKAELIKLISTKDVGRSAVGKIAK
jgi:hypothetical protein